MFKIDRADECIWLVDERGEKPVEIHLVPSQAVVLADQLRLAAEAGGEFHWSDETT